MGTTPRSREKKTSRSTTSAAGFSAEERAAMKERAAELKAAGHRGEGKAAADEAVVLSKIAEMPLPDRSVAQGVHSVVTDAAPELSPKLWYGQPAYARKGEVVCVFRSGQAEKTRCSVFGFEESAHLDEDGGMWPTSYALTEWKDATEAAIRKLVEKAVG